ncbi:hypothetical protein V6N13_009740 [Hibiscus sabdariffa]
MLSKKTTSLSDLIFFTKLHSLFWIKATTFTDGFEESSWWEFPQRVLVSCSPFVEGWVPTLSGFVKFSVDGAFASNRAGCGGILREDCGNIRILFSGPIESDCSDLAEVLVIFHALAIFREVGWIGKASLIVESDSVLALTWINDKLQRPLR